MASGSLSGVVVANDGHVSCFGGILQSLAIQLGERMLDNAGCLFSFVDIITVSSISFPARRNQRELELRMRIPLCCCRKSTNSRVSYPAMGL